jgi:carbohydrate-selective porin OprB
VESGNHGFDWELDGELGWVWIVELGYEYEGGVAKIGAYHSTGGQSDFATGEEVDGLSSLYAIIDRRIFGGEKGFGASVFLRGSVVGDSDRAVVESAGDAGIVFSNVVRAGDCLGFAVSLTNFGDAYVAATRAEDSYASDSETVVEATYEFPLMPGWILQPDIQYVIDPHASGEDVLVLGLRTVMEF